MGFFQLLLFPEATLSSPQAPSPGPSLPVPRSPWPEPSGASAPDPGSVAVLRTRLDRHLRGRLGALVLTDNSRRILSVRPVGERWDVRIHHCFLHAPEDTLRAVADFVARRGAKRRQPLSVIRQHFAQHTAPVVQVPRCSPRLRPCGACFDLAELKERVNREYFDGALDVAITWGRARSPRQRQRGGFHIRLGSYHEPTRLIRIHPLLDRPEVPLYVVESIVHHELLHAALPPVPCRSRRAVHTPEFRRRERLFRHFTAAETWLVQNLERLVRQKP